MSNANYIKKVFRHPCANPDFVIMVETALPAIALSLFEVAGIGCTDITKMKIGKSPWHTRKWNAFFKQSKEMEKMGNNAFLTAIGYGTIERGLWYWMVADAASAFVPNWMSLIYAEQKCDLPHAGYLETTLAVGFCFPGQINNIPPGGLDTMGCARFDGQGVTVVQGCYACVTYEVTMVAFHPEIYGQGTWRVWLEDEDGKRYGVSNGDTADVSWPYRNGGGINRTAPTTFGGHRLRVNFEVFTGVVGCSAGKIRVSAYGKRMDIIGQGCKPTPVNYPWAEPYVPPKPPKPPAPDPAKEPQGVPTPLGMNMRRDNRGIAAPNSKAKGLRASKPAKPRKPRGPRIIRGH